MLPEQLLGVYVPFYYPTIGFIAQLFRREYSICKYVSIPSESGGAIWDLGERKEADG